MNNTNEALDIKRIEEKLSAVNSILENSSSHLRTEYHKVWKNNMSMPAFTVISADTKITPNIYINKDMLSLSDEKLVEVIMDIYKKKTPEVSESFINTIQDVSYLLSNVRPRLVPASDFNVEGLTNSDYAYVPYENLGLLCTFFCPISIPFDDDNSRASVNISNRQLNELGIDKSTLLSHAIDNITKRIKLINMQELLSDLTGGDIAFLAPPETGPQMYVLTTDDQYAGAAAIISEEAIERTVETLGTDKLIIIPSSIEEVIIIPIPLNDESDDLIDDEYILSMVREVNDTQVEPTKRLSYSFFKYNKTDGFTEIRAA